jgi:hypothetical protein
MGRVGPCARQGPISHRTSHQECLELKKALADDDEAVLVFVSQDFLEPHGLAPPGDIERAGILEEPDEVFGTLWKVRSARGEPGAVDHDFDAPHYAVLVREDEDEPITLDEAQASQPHDTQGRTVGGDASCEFRPLLSVQHADDVAGSLFDRLAVLGQVGVGNQIGHDVSFVSSDTRMLPESSPYNLHTIKY